MNHAQIPATAGYPPLMTESPADLQAHVDQGARAADAWLARPWDDGEPHLEHLASLTPGPDNAAQDAYRAGYMGRIHQHLRTPHVEPGKQLISGSDELTMVLFNLLQEVAEQSGKGKLKPKSFAARDVMHRLEALAGALHDATDEINAEAGARHGR